MNGRSPKGTYLVADTGNPADGGRVSIAQRDQPEKFHDIFTYPRFAEVYFSPDERYLIIDNRNGSDSRECVVLSRSDKPPFFVNAHKIDEVCWKLFWSQHKISGKILYDHRSTYFCEWLDNSHFVVDLQGNHFFPDPGAKKWSLDGGWRCVYDAVRDKASTSRYTDSYNKAKAEFETDFK
ncbi:MAG: hypothetical protein WCD79_21540 [Chthoniobacteraceae bacterium]